MDIVLKLKVASIASSLIGTILLAWRVTGILKALTLVVECHESNISQIAGNSRINIQLTNSTNHVKRAHGTGTKLLILGFALYLASAILNAGIFYIEHLSQK